jgi:hypothetical protein
MTLFLYQTIELHAREKLDLPGIIAEEAHDQSRSPK